MTSKVNHLAHSDLRRRKSHLDRTAILIDLETSGKHVQEHIAHEYRDPVIFEDGVDEETI